MMQVSEFPKILYLSDVPVELSFAGATQLHRLLEHYPKDRLLIVQGMELNPAERLKGVPYHIRISKFINRLRSTRFARWLKPVLVMRESMLTKKELQLIRDFQPEAVLTVTFGLMWLKAFRASRKFNIPLHVILHDEWLMTEHYGWLQPFVRSRFADMYRHATGKYAIFPGLADHYERLFGATADVLYPLRGKNDTVYLPAVPRSDKKLRFCYLGSLFTADFPALLNQLSQSLAARGWELHIFSTTQKKDLGRYGYLTADHVFFHPFLPQENLLQKLNSEMDAGILLNSFEQEEAFKYNFSSKLVDYTSAGLPVLFQGPGTAGAISWALQLRYGAVLITPGTAELERLLDAFQQEEKRKQWAELLSEAGRSFFSYERNYGVLLNGILKSTQKYVSQDQ
ncbi:MAG: hypothetical protein ABW019_17450 [Chitinophagaceae bacterium]